MSTQRARRKYGVCYGTLWKQHSAMSSPPTLDLYKESANGDRTSIDVYAAAMERNDRGKNCEFCVLVGNIMTCYDNINAFERGDHPSVSRFVFSIILPLNCSLIHIGHISERPSYKLWEHLHGILHQHQSKIEPIDPCHQHQRLTTIWDNHPPSDY